MTSDQLRALADALCVRHYDLATVDVIRAADYLRACADAEPVAWLHDVVQDGDEPDQALSFYRDSFPLEGVGGFRSVGCVPLYTHPAPVAPQAEQTDAQIDYRALYHDLLFAVGNKHAGETRHETALRYIREAERSDGAALAARETK